ncbi:MAG: hypothetical protein ACAH83_17600 [Alphaproteobacteria bacterium]
MSITRKFREWKDPPRTSSSVAGFTLSMKKHEGALTRASEEGYYSVVMHRKGDNPEYPGVMNVQFYFGHAGKNGGMQGNVGTDANVMFLKHDCRYTRFEIVEDINPSGPQRYIDNVPEHHAVKLKVHYLDGKGQAEHAFRVVEGWVRKSELEVPAWDSITGTTQEERRAMQDRMAADAIALQDKVTVRKPLVLKKQP